MHLAEPSGPDCVLKAKQPFLHWLTNTLELNMHCGLEVFGVMC